MAKAALAGGLVDRIGSRREFEERLAQLGGKGDKGTGFARIKLSSYVTDVVERNPKGPIGIVTIAGDIVDG
jgi:protease-4